MDANDDGEPGPNVDADARVDPDLHDLRNRHQRQRHHLPVQAKLEHDVPQAAQDLGHLRPDRRHHLRDLVGHPHGVQLLLQVHLSKVGIVEFD